MSTKRSNFLTLIISLFFCFVILEVGLRIFTPFPINIFSNRVKHEKLGFVMKANVKEIDENGFRNDTLPSVDIVALGDSHTYGYNVSSDNSWPKLLGRNLRKNVYNFGMGGYGVLQYQYLLNKSIELNPEAILIGLDLHNDLFDVCQLACSNKQYWTPRANELSLDISLCPQVQKAQYTSGSVASEKKKFNTRKWLERNSAIVSIASTRYTPFILRKKIEMGKINYAFVVNEGKTKTMFGSRQIWSHEKYMDLNRPNIQMAYEVLKNFFLEAKKNSGLNNIRLGVLFIPSKERVFYKFLVQNDYDIPEKYKKLVDNEDELKEHIFLFLEGAQIPFIDVLPDMENALLEYGSIYPVRIDGHPNKIGYQIYAENALNLYQQIIK